MSDFGQIRSTYIALLALDWLFKMACVLEVDPSYYKIEIGVEVFLLAITGSILVAGITIAIKASIANPINVLKTE